MRPARLTGRVSSNIMMVREDKDMSDSSRVAFAILGFPIYWYGLLIAAGLVLGALCASLREKRIGVKKDTAVDFLLLALPMALVFARAYYVIFAWDNYAAHPLSAFNLREGGLAIYGGVIGGVLAAALFCRRKKLPFGALADLCAPALALGQAVGRWGNFFNQEAYGVVFSNPALHRFPLSVFIEADGLWHAATFFYESVWCLAVTAALLIFERARLMKRQGDLFAAYLFLYATERVVVEGLRTDSLMLGGLRVSQLLSAALMLGVLAAIGLRARPLEKRSVALLTGAVLALAALLTGVARGTLSVQVACAGLVILLGGAFYRTARGSREETG